MDPWGGETGESKQLKNYYNNFSSMEKFRLKRYLATVIYLNKKGKAKVFVFAVAFLLKIKERIGQYQDVFPFSPYFTFLGPYKQDTEFDLKL